MSNQLGCTRVLLATDVFNARFTAYSRQKFTDSSGSQTVPPIYRSGRRLGRRQHNQTGYQQLPQTEVRKELQTSGVTSNNPTAPQNKSARHPESQSASQNCQNHTFSVTPISDRSSGTEVLARRLIGTCAQMETIIRVWRWISIL